MKSIDSIIPLKIKYKLNLFAVYSEELYIRKTTWSHYNRPSLLLGLYF